MITEKMLLLLLTVFLFLFIVVAGFGIVYYVANRKWGYTKKREKELEKEGKMFGKKAEK